MQIRSIRRALALALAAAGLCSAAQAQSAPSIDSMQFKDWLAAQARSKAQSKQDMVAGVADTTPPRLISFNAVDSVDIGVPGEVMLASFKASDDLAGVTGVSALATGPGGQRISLSFSQAAPIRQLADKMHSKGLPAFVQPGVYTFAEAYVFDAANNYLPVDAATLATLGKVSFEVKNDHGYDVSPPSLVSGTIVTPKVSLAATHPGTSQPKYVQMAIETTDAGNSALAGVKSAMADFCLAGQSQCIFVSSNSDDTRPTVAKASLKLATQIYDKTTPLGDYRLRSISVTDYAGNFQYLKSTEFGGTTDFSAYFPSTTIKLVP